MTIIEGLVCRNAGARTHYHLSEDESFFLLNGTYPFAVDGWQFCAQPRTTAFIPRNVTQSFRYINDKPIHVQILFTPSGREEFLAKFSFLNDNPPVNSTLLTTLLLRYGQVNLPEVSWQNIGCEAND